jgi:hypothetical protein
MDSEELADFRETIFYYLNLSPGGLYSTEYRVDDGGLI